ncbi:nitrate reductase cytochrome c-type subunit [Colwellia sp. D2M02]|uniref:Periplasmic nitrate reductase, electron transfer subunit n=1 Tax=Colwellia asteriadis TaxID=517723 RepID=A0ABN1L8M6_9GAMM|nr:nitrate reductase cytochrome c-type subunit [Colwellia sp. D2M02]MBU2892411.1 nitrate reductase cytochrome c-type subunit [Colwellia sp. D2M02]
MKKFNLITMSSLLIMTLAPLFYVSTAISADKDTINTVATLRDHTKVDEQKTPNTIPQVMNKDIKQTRNYPMQPPVIPHTTRSYEVNTNSNKCMSCHSRHRTEKSQAPMVSVTHYMDRDGNFLAEVSPRRYFCNQCHVTQVDAKPLVENTFTDMHSLMKNKVTSAEKD